jgi:hypothetical protein
VHAIEGTISRFSDGTTMLLRCEGLEPPMSHLGQPLPSQDFRDTAALSPETGHRSARLAWQKSASRRHSHSQQIAIYSITSSARASSEGETSMPRLFAVLRLITSSYLVGVCTGRSAGFSLIGRPQHVESRTILAKGVEKAYNDAPLRGT